VEVNMAAYDERLFDEYYFKHDCGRPYERSEVWLQFFAGIAEAIVRKITPRTVLDAGCAMGFLVEGLRERGVEAYGIDVSEYALQQVRDDLKPYCRPASVTDPLPQHYNLLVCIEVLEHLPAQTCERAVENFCRASDDVLFSSTPEDYKEMSHLNVQPAAYWAGLFALNGFIRDVDFDASFITPWAVRFRKSNEPLPRVIQDYERRFYPLWKENCDLRSQMLELRNQLAAKDRQLASKDEQLAAKDQQFLDMQNSNTWRLAKKIQRVRQALVPLGSKREQLMRRVLRTL
jgi:SAM-dependent methyltransferase